MGLNAALISAQPAPHGAARIEIRRLKADNCKGNFPAGLKLLFTWSDLKLMLKSAMSFLSQVHILVSAVGGLFRGAGDPDASARLNDISNRIAHERDAERQLNENGRTS
ncbi:MAG: hypothetical protein WBX25_31500 [Rhodomicrobium sp.]